MLLDDRSACLRIMLWKALKLQQELPELVIMNCMILSFWSKFTLPMNNNLSSFIVITYLNLF